MTKPNYIDEIIFDNNQIIEATKILANKLNAEYSDVKEGVILVGLLKGCIPFLAELIKHLTFDVIIDFMVASSYNGGTESSGNVKVIMDLNIDIYNRHVLIVDDLIETGGTLAKIKANLKNKNPKSIKIVTLLTKNMEVKSDIKPDFSGLVCGSEFLVGFGLDYEEKLRNLPFIGIFNKDKWDKK